MVTDIIGKQIQVDDYVMFYSNIYQVVSLGKARNNGSGTVRIILVDKAKTTKPVNKFSKDMCVLDKNQVLLWMLKGN